MTPNSSSSQMPVQEYLVINHQQSRYAVDIHRVGEVLPLPPLTRLPNAPDRVAGVFNLRGKIVPALAFPPLISSSPSPYPPSETTCIVLLYGDPDETIGPVGLMVEQLPQVKDLGPLPFEAAPDLKTLPHELFSGAFTDDDDLVYVLDTGVLLQKTDAQQTQSS